MTRASAVCATSAFDPFVDSQWRNRASCAPAFRHVRARLAAIDGAHVIQGLQKRAVTLPRILGVRGIGSRAMDTAMTTGATGATPDAPRIEQLSQGEAYEGSSAKGREDEQEAEELEEAA